MNFPSVRESLDYLEAAEDIHDVLAEHGVTGVRENCEMCVIARWLRATVPDLIGISVTPFGECLEVRWTMRGLSPQIRYAWPVLSDFAGRFDNGDYPELEMSDGAADRD